MEIKLTDNSRLYVDWLKSGALSVQCYRPGNARDGHGLLLAGTAIIEGEELTALLDALRQPQAKEKAA